MAEGDNSSVHIRVGDEESRTNGKTATVAGSSNTTRINQIAPTQAEAAAVINQPPARHLATRLAKLLFFICHVALAILITFLTIRGFLSPDPPTFHHAHFYLPLLASAASSALVAITWLLLVLCYPSKALRTSLWLGPFLALGAGVLLLAAGSGGSLGFAALFLALALILSLYACWVVPRFEHAERVLAFPAVKPSFTTSKLIAVALTAGLIYSCFWTLGVGGIAAHSSRYNALYLLVLWLGLAWTMHVIRNVVHVALSRVAYISVAHGLEIDVRGAFRDAATRALGSVCFGSTVEPTVGVIRGAARSMGLITGDSDEFLFSCASCSIGIADWLVACANIWGFVHVGVYDKGFLRASKDTWEMFEKQGMVRLIDLDLTGSFCFYCGVAGGAVAALVGGSWVLALHEGYVTGVAIYGFFIGYFVNRIAMAWPQACVSAYHVAYAENPQNQRLGSTIRDRIRNLQSSRD